MGAVDEEAGAPDRMRGGHNALLDLLCMGLSPIFAGDPSPAQRISRIGRGLTVITVTQEALTVITVAPGAV